MSFWDYTLWATLAAFVVWFLSLLIKTWYMSKHHGKDATRIQIMQAFNLAVFPPIGRDGTWTIHRKIGDTNVKIAEADNLRAAFDLAQLNLAPATEPAMQTENDNG